MNSGVPETPRTGEPAIDPAGPARRVSRPVREEFGAALPARSGRREWLVRGAAVVSYAYAMYWLYWRWTASLNWDVPVFSVALVTAETFGVLATGLLIWTVWTLEDRVPPIPADDLGVDVFITVYNEPLQLIRRTAIGARAITYPHTTYILDDGKRDELRLMAADLGIGYIRRAGSEHAKAGNLNHALTETTGEFILQLDADHVPLPTILSRLLGYFENPKVAIVQSPQDFYNTDSFTHVVNDEGRRFWEENRIFFSLIQPGKDRVNAAFFCGSCGVLRRSALESIGGFSTQSITEDMETSIVLHGQGWESVYHGETLAYGLSPASAGQYHVQRLRWGQGAMQILRKLNPLTYPGLTVAQRLSYFSSVIVYLDGPQKLIFYLAPIIYFLTGWIPVRTTNHALMVRLVPHLLLTVLSFELLARGTGYLLISERYNMTKFFTYTMSLSAFFTRKPIKFNVTPKGEGEVPWRTYAPQAAIAALSAISLVWALVAVNMGWVDYHVDSWWSVAFVVNAIWVCWNGYFAVAVVRHSINSRQVRADHRFGAQLPITIRAVNDGRVKGDIHHGITRDFNATGLSFRSVDRFALHALLEIPLPLGDATIVVCGRVSHAERDAEVYGDVWTHGIVFEGLAIESRDAIELYCSHHAVPSWHQRYRESVDPVTNVVERFKNPRGGRRMRVELPALIGVVRAGDSEPWTGIGLLEEVSREGARLILENPIDPGSQVAYEVPGTQLRGQGKVVFSRLFESPMQARFAVGIDMRAGKFSWRGLPIVRRFAVATMPRPDA